jgi:hypothetical protein
MRHAAAGVVLGIAGMLAAVAPARGSAIDLVETSYTVSTQGAVNVNSFVLTGPGTLTLTLTDLRWPTSIQEMTFLVATTTGTIIGQGSGFGSESFQIAGPGTVYAVTYGQAAPLPGLSFGYGSYGVSATFQAQAVPLPTSAALLLSGLGILWIAFRRRESPLGAGSRTHGRFAIKL